MLVRKFVLFLLTVALLISMVPAACAEGDGEYVLLRSADGKNLQYQSPYTMDNHYYKGVVQSRMTPELYSMYDTQNNVIFPTYCLDINTGAARGVYYRRQNLEDSTYSASAAGLIRAIVLNGFYINPNDYSSYDAHEAAVDAQLLALAGRAGVENLTLGEAISATQCALWMAAHGSVLTYGDNFARSYVSKPSSAAVEYADMCSRELNGIISGQQGSLPTDVLTKVNHNIRTVYSYLMALNPVGPTRRVVSAASFKNVENPVFTLREDGSYDVTITTTVDVDGGDLTLTASAGEKSVWQELGSGRQQITLTIEGVSMTEEVTLSISGTQTGNDVYLYDAEGVRGEAQTMVGKDNRTLPVFAQITAEKNRVLNITKTTGSGQALKGIIFDIYRVEGDVDLENPQNYVPSGLAEYTVITNESGYASLNFTQHGLEDGIYLVVERDHPAIVSPIAPFFVVFPRTNEEGTGYEYEISVYPKNDVKGDIGVQKDVIVLDNDKASVNAGEAHTWIISASIPDDIAQGASYVISDTLDSRLDYAGNFKAMVETTDGQTVAQTLTENLDYTLTVNDVDSMSEGNPQDSFQMQLTADGMSKVAAAVGVANTSNYKIRVYFDAKINGNAEVAVEIPNQSTVRYVNSLDFAFTARSDVPVVYTGAANLLKVDAENEEQVLEGAEFEVYRPATPEELGANAEGLTTIEGVVEKVIQMSFFDNAQMTGEKVFKAATDKDGRLAIYGLAYGDYYLVETKAPGGYNLLEGPKKITISETSHLDENVMTVENISGAILPETGGIGTEVFAFSGMLLMAVSLLMLLDRKRRKAN